MVSADSQFEHQLEVFRTEAEAGTQFFYASLAVHAVAAKNKHVYKFLNQTPLFWNTCLGALQAATFITLGRVFDTDSGQNIDKLLCLAQNNPQIFSKEALGKRKQSISTEPCEWLDEYLRGAYEPTPRDFRRIRAHVQKQRKVYDRSYRVLRNKVFAHKEVSDRAETAALFGNTNIRELERLFVFLLKLYEALWQLYFNGRKPLLRPLRYSVKRMRDLPSSAIGNTAVQERITREAERFLLSASESIRRTP